MNARAAGASALVATGLLGSLLYFAGRRAEGPAPTPPTPLASSPPRRWTPPPSAAAAASSDTAAPTPSDPEPDAEQLLRELEVLSVTDKPRALSLALAADERVSPVGVMAEARRALIVTLMVDLGRMPEARARTWQFMRRYPNSRYLPLVQGATGIHPRPRPSELRDAR